MESEHTEHPSFSGRGQLWGVAEYRAHNPRTPATEPASPAMRFLQATYGMDADSAERYQRPYNYDELQTHLPELTDLDEAAERLADAVMEARRPGGRGIGISGDYDCDGNCSTALMIRFLRESGVPAEKIHVHIPNREGEGYGVNGGAVEAMAEKNVGTLLTLDNGTLAHEPLALANTLGMQTLVVDHHPNSANQDLPEGALVVNPKRADETLSDPAQGAADMAAVGVTWLIAKRATEKLKARGFYEPLEGRCAPDPKQWLGLVALATIGDVVSMARPINRSLVAQGLEVIRRGDDPLIAAFAAAARIPDISQLKEEDIQFTLTPIINAPGRLGQSVAWTFLSPPVTEEATNTVIKFAREGNASLHDSLHHLRDEFMQAGAWAVPKRKYPRRDDDWFDSYEEQVEDMLSTHVPEGEVTDHSEQPAMTPQQYALVMLSIEANQRRKLVETALFRKLYPMALEKLGTDPANPKRETLLLTGEGWHEGVIGIVAGRLKDTFNMPVMVASINRETGMCKASARGVPSPGERVDVGQFVRDARDAGLMTKAGGHPMAAGCSFSRNQATAIEEMMERTVGPVARVVRTGQRRLLAGALDMAQMTQGEKPIDLLMKLKAAQEALRPHGQGADKPMVALYGCSIGSIKPGRNGRDLSLTVSSANPQFDGRQVRISAFKAARTRLEALLNAPKHPDKVEELILIGTLGEPYHGAAGSMELRLEDIVPLPAMGKRERWTPPNLKSAVAKALGVGALRERLDGIFPLLSDRRAQGPEI